MQFATSWHYHCAMRLNFIKIARLLSTIGLQVCTYRCKILYQSELFAKSVAIDDSTAQSHTHYQKSHFCANEFHVPVAPSRSHPWCACRLAGMWFGERREREVREMVTIALRSRISLLTRFLLAKWERFFCFPQNEPVLDLFLPPAPHPPFLFWHLVTSMTND